MEQNDCDLDLLSGRDRNIVIRTDMQDRFLVKTVTSKNIKVCDVREVAKSVLFGSSLLVSELRIQPQGHTASQRPPAIGTLWITGESAHGREHVSMSM